MTQLHKIAIQWPTIHSGSSAIHPGHNAQLSELEPYICVQATEDSLNVKTAVADRRGRGRHGDDRPP